jgi:hypothetical protein
MIIPVQVGHLQLLCTLQGRTALLHSMLSAVNRSAGQRFSAPNLQYSTSLCSHLSCKQKLLAAAAVNGVATCVLCAGAGA